MKPRYAIVRVDNKCPSYFEGIDTLNVCAEPLRYYMNKSVNCKNCRYGDTKEQLIQKVYQAIVTTKQKIKEGKYNFVTYKGLAQIIVEFLGVEK